MYTTSEKKPFAPTAGGIKLLYVLYIEKVEAVYKMFATVAKCVTQIPPRWFCDTLWKVRDYKEGILMSPLLQNSL